MKPPCQNPGVCYRRCKHGAFPCDKPEPNTENMYRIKVFTHNPNGPLSKNNKIVIAAYQKGLTGIKVTRHMGKGYQTKKGYVLESEQVPYLHLGFEVAEAVQRVNEISLPTKN